MRARSDEEKIFSPERPGNPRGCCVDDTSWVLQGLCSRVLQRCVRVVKDDVYLTYNSSENIWSAEARPNAANRGQSFQAWHVVTGAALNEHTAPRAPARPTLKRPHSAAQWRKPHLLLHARVKVSGRCAPLCRGVASGGRTQQHCTPAAVFRHGNEERRAHGFLRKCQ